MGDRPPIDTLIVVLTYTICALILMFGAVVAVIEIRDPAADTSDATAALTHLTTTILGVLLGMLAGRRRAD